MTNDSKQFREIFAELLESRTTPKVEAKIRAIFPELSGKEISNKIAMAYTLMAKAIADGDVRAFDTIAQFIGESKKPKKRTRRIRITL